MSEEQDPLTAQCQQRIGALLSAKWRLEFLIGVGGMAAVYAATHRNGARAAIKILHPEFAGHQDVRARFLREAYIANKVDHPGTVKVLDDDIAENGEPYLVMELLAGESVEGRAQRSGGWLQYAEVLSITEQTLAVLEKAHAVGVVHRDLKPDNLFLTSKGVVKVLDFGIARLHEAAGQKRTQTGMMMGTPMYMAPEQALGRWSQVDGRTDLWSVGAIMFTLLSGQAVHQANTDNEVLIHAATRPARSLARVVTDAPLELVSVVDRALQFEQDQRFPDAASMRGAVVELMQRAGIAAYDPDAPPPSRASAGRAPASVAGALMSPVTSGPGAVPAGGGTGATMPQGPAGPTVQGSAGFSGAGGAVAPQTAAQPAPTVAKKRDEALREADAFDAAYATDEDIASMKELFVEVERALVARIQYGDSHPETRRKADKAFRVCASALMHSEYGLVWNVTPYSFSAKETSLWEPSSPFDRIPYQLFSDGIRLLGLTTGITEQEFAQFFHLLTLDRATDVAPEDDFVTLLWDASFKHVVYHAIDAFSEGDQQRRLKFEQDCNYVVNLAHSDTNRQLQHCWQVRQKEKQYSAMSAKQRQILQFLNTGERVDREALAKAAQKDAKEGRLGPAPVDPSALLVDDAVRTMLAARLTMDTASMSERFVVAAARAFEDGLLRGNHVHVTTPLRFAIDGLAKNDPTLAIDMVGALCREVGQTAAPADADRMRAILGGAIVSPRMMEAVLEGAAREGAEQDVYAKGLRSIVGFLDDTHFTVVMKGLPPIEDEVVRDVLIDYMQRVGRGHEHEMAELFVDADVELGLALVRVLAGIKTPEAREAISEAVKSPQPVVRIEALGHLEGVSSERLRLEIRTLLEDNEPGVRLAALKAMEKYGIRVAGPFLVLRIRSQGFDGLPLDERRQAFQTLTTLAPNRTEAVALEVLNDGRLVTTDSHEESRELAAEWLGRVGRTQESFDALKEVASRRWKNSDRARSAATAALATFTERVKAQGQHAAQPADKGRRPQP